jgi:gluconate 2-dehydrogenase gamma chain
MDRRKSLKLLAGSVSVAALLNACKTDDKAAEAVNTGAFDAKKFPLDRAKEEVERETKLAAAKPFFTEHEMATIALLSDIIIPKDEVSGSATDAGVPDFIAFIVHDMPEHQVPLKGGLRWLDMQCLKQFNADFKSCTAAQQIQIVDAIAYPKKAAPEMKQGVKFFSLMRDLTASGFYTSKIGIADIGYKGNVANKWNGVPDDVLKQHGIAYTEKELNECINYDKV